MAASTAASFLMTAHSIPICAKRWRMRLNVTDSQSICRASVLSKPTRSILMRLPWRPAIACAESPRCRMPSCRLSATCNGAMPRSDGLQPGALRRAVGATAGPFAALITTKRFGTLFGARRGCYLATAIRCEVHLWMQTAPGMLFITGVEREAPRIHTNGQHDRRSDCACSIGKCRGLEDHDRGNDGADRRGRHRNLHAQQASGGAEYVPAG